VKRILMAVLLVTVIVGNLSLLAGAAAVLAFPVQGLLNCVAYVIGAPYQPWVKAWGLLLVCVVWLIIHAVEIEVENAVRCPLPLRRKRKE